MARINIILNNKTFPVECDESQAELVQKSAERINSKFEHLKKSSPMASTEYLLLLCAITLESENISKINDVSENDIRGFESKLEEISNLTEALSQNLKK